MSNLSGLRATLKKMKSNGARLPLPPVLRDQGTLDAAGTTDRGASPRSVALDPPPDDFEPDVIALLRETRTASDVATHEKIGTLTPPATSPHVRVFAAPVHSRRDAPTYPEALPDGNLSEPVPQDSTSALDQRVSEAPLVDDVSSAEWRQDIEATAAPTAEQRAVACAPADERQLVIAGPGTGKTFTLVRRLEYLLGSGEVGASQILVLSFSRSAVREIRTRLRARVSAEGAHGDLDYVDVRTFDSFAFRLLDAVGQKPVLSNDNYDQNIRLAARAILKKGSEAREIVGDVRHLIVDELQDLVGVRAILVENMLNAMDGGFTLLGDPAQAIYDYSARQNQSMTATTFLSWLREQGKQWHMRERTLHANLRGSSECFALSERHRPAVLQADHPKADPKSILTAFNADLNSQPESGTIVAVAHWLRDLPEGETAAILCRSNNEALQVHRLLLEQRIAHVMAINTEERGLPAWVARVFSTWTQRSIRQPEFLKQWSDRVGSRTPLEPEQAWQALTRAMGEPDGTRRVEMEELRTALARRPELPGDTGEAHAAITVSTIHRAKGREYDRVIVLEGVSVSHRHLNSEAAAEEARVLYVATTRPRKRLSVLRRDALGRLRPLLYGGRERGTAKLGADEALVQVGLRGDVDDSAGVSTALSSYTVEYAQDCLWHLANVATQATVNLKRGRPEWSFRILKPGDDLVLGYTSSAFGRDMELMSHWLDEPVDTLSGVPVRSVETVLIETHREGSRQPYERSGFCLAIRLQGAVFVGKWRR